MADYPYPCRSKGTKITPIQTTMIDTSIIGRLWGVRVDLDNIYYKITSINANLTLLERDAILDHYKNPVNLLSEFIWSWNAGEALVFNYSVMYVAPPKFKWTKNNRWTVTSGLHGHEII